MICYCSVIFSARLCRAVDVFCPVPVISVSLWSVMVMV